MNGGFALAMSVSLENPMYKKVSQISLFLGVKLAPLRQWCRILGPGVYLANKAIFVKTLYKRGMFVRCINSPVHRVAFSPKLCTCIASIVPCRVSPAGWEVKLPCTWQSWWASLYTEVIFFNIFFYVAHGWLCHNNFFLIRTTVVVMLTVAEIRVACPFPNIPRLTKY